MALAAAHAAAAVVVVAHALVAAVRLRIEGLLLVWRQGGVEGLGGLAPAVGLGGVLGAQGPHAVDAFGRGELVHVLAVQAGSAFPRLHRGAEGRPGGFLGGAQLELVLQGGHALGHVGLVARMVLVAVTPCLVAAFGGCGGTRCRRGGWRLLGQDRQGQCSENSGGGQAVLESENHGVSPFTGLGTRQDDRSGD